MMVHLGVQRPLGKCLLQFVARALRHCDRGMCNGIPHFGDEPKADQRHGDDLFATVYGFLDFFKIS